MMGSFLVWRHAAEKFRESKTVFDPCRRRKRVSRHG